MTEWTQETIFEALRKLFPSPAFVLLPQVRNGTGFLSSVRTIDALVVSTWPSRGLYVAGIEIKIHPGDWKRELARPDKSEDIQSFCRYWYVAAPEGVVPVAEVPETWGLIECRARGPKIIKPAPILPADPPDMLLVASILRSAEKATVPLHVLEDRVDKRVETETKRLIRETQSRQDTIARFEEAAGVRIGDRWNCERIGEAVKIVLKGDHLEVNNLLRRVRNDAEMILKIANEALAEPK